jgi:hypothetical protein
MPDTAQPIECELDDLTCRGTIGTSDEADATRITLRGQRER